VEELATRLAGRGHSVYVYVRAHWSDPLLKTYKGVHIIRTPSLHSKGFEKIFKFFGNIDAFSHAFFSTLHVLSQRADIIHYHGIGPGMMAWIPRLFKWRSKVVVTFHSRDSQAVKWSIFARTLLLFAEWSALIFPHETIVVSHLLQIFCRDVYGKRTTYIPNGAVIPGPQGVDKLKELGLKPGKYLLGVGRLVPGKAYDLLMEAYAKIKSPMPIVIAGDAEYADEYVQKLERLMNRDPRIHLIGFQTGETLSQLLAHCYAFIHPSRAEGLSTSILEAMACAKTVVMADIKENCELVDHSGITFPVDHVKALRETLDWILRDPTLVRVRGERAREIVERWYSWNSVVDQIERRYHSLIK